uniref:Uncharacterized protein n=1 Tax=Chelydra serpentina TaxID=8475 RepID=A0A8C3SU30_CHESE
VTEDHGLGDGDGSIYITEKPFLQPQRGNRTLNRPIRETNWLWWRGTRIFPFPQTVQMTVWGWSLPLNADALILMALGCYHHISLIQDKHFNLLGVYEFQFGAPVQDSARSANYNLLRDLLTSLHCHICKT